MNRFLKALGWSVLATMLLGALLLAAIVAALGSAEHAVININGQPFGFGQLDVGDWLVATGGAAIALAVGFTLLLVVLPLALLVPLLIVGAVLAAVALAMAGVAAVAVSPLIALVGLIWLVVRLSRGRRPAQRDTVLVADDAGATMLR